MVSMYDQWSFFRNFENTFSCFAVAIFDLVHDVEAIFTFLNCYKYLETVFLIEPRYEKTSFLHVRNKDADQLRGNREADQRLCFRYTDSTIPLLPKSEISSF